METFDGFYKYLKYWIPQRRNCTLSVFFDQFARLLIPPNIDPRASLFSFCFWNDKKKEENISLNIHRRFQLIDRGPEFPFLCAAQEGGYNDHKSQNKKQLGLITVSRSSFFFSPPRDAPYE